MDGILEDFIKTTLSQAVPKLGFLYENLAQQIMYFEKYVTNCLPKTAFMDIYNFIYIFACSLLALKIIKKGFYVYILWRDGDTENSPKEMITSIILAVVLAVGFPTLYTYLADISLWLVEHICGLIFGNVYYDNFLDNLQQMGENTALGFCGIVPAIGYLIYFISLIIFWFQVIRRSIEMFILRLGFPLACIGLVDSDSGVFKPYVKLLYQSSLTMIVQILCFSLAKVLIYNNYLMFAIGAMIAAINGPTLMASILANTGGSGNIGYKVQQAVNITNVARSFFKK